MQFQTPTQQSCYEKISPWMVELFEDAVMSYEAEEPVFVINFGSAVAYTEVIPWGENEAIVVTRSWVVTDIAISPDLMYYLLRENDSLYFGRFAIDDEDHIVFEHSLVGSSCDRQELKASVVTVVKFADEYDDKIVTRWGGQRAADRSRITSEELEGTSEHEA